MTSSAAFRDAVLASRTRASSVTADVLRRILVVYARAADDLAAEARRTHGGRRAWALRMTEAANRRAVLLSQALEQTLGSGLSGTVGAVAQPAQSLLLSLTGVWPEGRRRRAQAGVRALFSSGSERAVVALAGRSTPDGLTLSERVWRTGNVWRRGATAVIEDAAAQDMDPRRAARELGRYLRPGEATAHKAETARRLGIPRDVSFPAMRLARTELHLAATEGTYLANRTTPGYRGVVWRLSAQHRLTDACDDLANETAYGRRGFYPEGQEPVPPHPQCVVAGTVISGPAVLATTARVYVGDLVHLRTAAGRHVTVTPNHPVLTPQGWVAAGELDAGCYLVCARGSEHAVHDPDDHQVPALVEEVARAPGEPVAVSAVAVPPAPAVVPVGPLDFHGDGAGSTWAVVHSSTCYSASGPSGRSLRDAGPLGSWARYGRATWPRGTPADGKWRNGPHPESKWGASLSAPTGHHTHALASAPGAQDGRPGVGDTTPARWPVAGRAMHPDALVRADGAPRGAVLGTPAASPALARLLERSAAAAARSIGRTIPDGGTSRGAHHIAGTAHSSWLDNTMASGISGGWRPALALDRITRVRRRWYCGQVYNLQTTEGWYSANSIIVHNCMCTVLPVYEPLADLAARLASWADDPTGRTEPDVERWYRTVGRPAVARPAQERGAPASSRARPLAP